MIYFLISRCFFTFLQIIEEYKKNKFRAEFSHWQLSREKN